MSRPDARLSSGSVRIDASDAAASSDPLQSGSLSCVHCRESSRHAAEVIKTITLIGHSKGESA